LRFLVGLVIEKRRERLDILRLRLVELGEDVERPRARESFCSRHESPKRWPEVAPYGPGEILHLEDRAEHEIDEDAPLDESRAKIDAVPLGSDAAGRLDDLVHIDHLVLVLVIVIRSAHDPLGAFDDVRRNTAPLDESDEDR